MGIRIGALIGLFAVLYSLLGMKIYDVQVRDGDRYGAQAASLHELTGVLAPRRGSIYFTDKEGNRIPAAINKEYATIYAVPSEVTDPQTAASVLAEITGEDEATLYDRLAKSDDPYEPILEKPTEEQVSTLNEYGLAGIYAGERWARFYPLDNHAAHVLGYSSVADSPIGTGRYGAESQFDDRLRGVPGITDGDKLIPPKNGEDVYLTIDRNIQIQAENILENLIAEYSAQGGQVIVEDPKTGKILAMAAKPDFDPNSYGKFDISRFLNPSVEAVYEPGSIFKVITMSAGIDSGAITPDTTYTDTGEVTLNSKTIRNWDLKSYGTVSMTRVIERSLNTGAVFAQRAMGQKTFYDYLVKFGLKEKKDIDLPGEIVGSLNPLEDDIREINYATASFGQGISVTPIGLITALSAIANDGVMMAPYLNAEREPEEVRRVISPESARKVQEMMVSAVEKAEIPRIRGYNVAGKTGTAQAVNFASGGYYEDEVINTYIGFAPAYDPAFVILVRLDRPYGAPLAGLTVVPAFRELAQFVINYYGILPDAAGNL